MLESSFQGLGLQAEPGLFDQLDSAYGETSRHYHGRTHIVECLKQLARFAHLVERLPEVELAIWFHDAIYDTHRHDNELRSAQWAERALQAAGADAPVVQRVVDMIVATKTHAANSPDGEVMVDIDLGILGTPPDIFDAYDAAIRAEYHWVPLPQYKAGRAQVLRSFLERDQIYCTNELRELCEERARDNLQRKIVQLAQ